MKYSVTISFILSLLLTGPAWPQGEHGRRLAAELLILLGDARALTTQPPPSDLHRKGLQDRLHGGLSGLAILMRLADQEIEQPHQNARSIVEGLRTALREKNLAGFTKVLSGLTAKYPLATTGIYPAGQTPTRLKRAAEIHQNTCAGCHDEPDIEVERPAHNLFQQVKAMSSREFLARMIIGVRGDRTTGLGNPLTDEEISALISYYRTSRP